MNNALAVISGIIAVIMLVISVLSFAGKAEKIILFDVPAKHRGLFSPKLFKACGWCALVVVAFCVVLVVGILMEDYPISIFFAWLAVYMPISIWGMLRSWATESPRFRKDPSLPVEKFGIESFEPTDKQLKRFGYGMVTALFLLPFILLIMALV